MVDWIDLAFGGASTFAAVFLAFFLERRWEVTRGRAQAAAKRQKVLALAIRELEENAAAIKARGASDGLVASVYAQALLQSPLKDDVWLALSDGGELQWVSDLSILNGLADAYYWVRSVKQFEDQVTFQDVSDMLYLQKEPTGFSVLQNRCANAQRRLAPILEALRQAEATGKRSSATPMAAGR